MASGVIHTGRMVVEHDAGDTTAQSGVGKTIASITIPSTGIWMIVASCSFSANALGQRQLGISQNETANWMTRFARTTTVGNGTYATRMLTTTWEAAGAGRVFYARAYQDSNSTLTVTECGLKAVKVSD